MQAQENRCLPERYAYLGFGLIFIGLWLFFVGSTFGFDRTFLINDTISGLSLIILGCFVFTRRYSIALNLAGLLGIWLQFAPLVFWAPSAVYYLNDTLCGIIVIIFSLLLPRKQTEIEREVEEIPYGWSYNPSSWPQRIPAIALGVIGWFFARYMAAFQLGFIDTIFDPIFGEGTFKVITSSVSHAFPISDAGFGAFAYTLEVIVGCQGGTRRWYLMPWSVIFFALLVIPVGIVSLLLVVLQPVVVGYWCFWCLVVALCMLLMITFTVNEVIATLQFLIESKRRNKPLWHTFWYGGTPMGAEFDRRTPPFCGQFHRTFPAMVWGVTLPWNLLLTTLAGCWLMALPACFLMESTNVINFVITGALVVVISVIAFAEVARTIRWLNAPLGIWVLLSLFILPSDSFGGIISQLIIGLGLILLTIPKGKILEQYGFWQKHIR